MMLDTGCEYDACEDDGRPVDVPRLGSVRLCGRHRNFVLAGAAAIVPIEVTPALGDRRRRLRVKRQLEWTRDDWQARYAGLEAGGHRVEAVNVWFLPRRGDVAAEGLACSCGWRGGYLMWPDHVLGRARGGAGHSPTPGRQFTP